MDDHTLITFQALSLVVNENASIRSKAELDLANLSVHPGNSHFKFQYDLNANARLPSKFVENSLVRRD
jgi:hypothetical protein